ncbi:MAG: hypothetical protein AAB337_02925 [Patescibacteria group bacterium]
MKAKSKRRLGLFIVIASVAILLMLLPAYAVISFVISQILVVNESSNIGVIGPVINFILGLSGVLALVGVPIGAVLMARAGLDPKAGEHLKEEVGFGHLSNEHAAFLAQWSLGAFLNPIVWAFGNKLWRWALGLLVPIVITPFLGILLALGSVIPVIVVVIIMIGWSFFATIYLIVRGRRLAWKRGWDSFEKFQKRQRFMLWLIIILGVVAVIISLIINALAPPDPVSDDSSSVSSEQPFTSICARYEDIDQDYLTTSDENKFNTDPNSADTDGDGYDDLSELVSGYDPGTFDPKVLAAKFTGSGSTNEEVRQNWLADYEQKQRRCKE